jgi:hypothetical protein
MKRLISLLTLMSWVLVACDAVVTPATPTPREVVEIVLREAASLACPDYGDEDNTDFYRRFSMTDTVLMFECTPATGHYTSARLWWFSDPSEARAAFETRNEGDTVQEFHEFPLAVWEEDYPSFPGGRKEYRIWLWQVQGWLIEVRAFDDTHYITAPDPETVSETIYQVGVEHGLFAGGDQ